MRSAAKHRLLLAALVGGLALVLMPLTVEAASGKWIDEITVLTMDHQELAKLSGRERGYDDYLEQIAIVRVAFTAGDVKRTNVAMNRLMDMLEADAKGGGIPVWSAKTIFDFCGKVTPNAYHDYRRHNRELSKGGFDYWADDVFDPGDSG